MMGLTYLASPYTHPDPAVVAARFEAACKAAANMMMQGWRVFSPIAHSHPIEQLGMAERMPGPFWMNQDIEVLRHCESIALLTIPGWSKSNGMSQEIALSGVLSIPMYVTPDGTTIVRVWSEQQLKELAETDQ